MEDVRGRWSQLSSSHQMSDDERPSTKQTAYSQVEITASDCIMRRRACTSPGPRSSSALPFSPVEQLYGGADCSVATRSVGWHARRSNHR